MRTNYILIDFESVQPETLKPLNHDHFKVFVFVGANQKKLPTDVVTSVHRLGNRAEYVTISGNGSNALDFHIAYYIGRLAAADSSAYFHIISKDAGFDPLINHLKSKQILSGRAERIADIPALKASNSKPPQGRLAAVLAKLKQLKAAKPRTVKTLSSTIASLFQNQLSSDEVTSLVQSLASQRHLEIKEGKIVYALPES